MLGTFIVAGVIFPRKEVLVSLSWVKLVKAPGLFHLYVVPLASYMPQMSHEPVLIPGGSPPALPNPPRFLFEMILSG